MLHQEEHVPNDVNAEVLRKLAKLGAQARLEQIEMERQAILKAFPDLVTPGRGRKRGPRTRVARAAVAAPAARRRRRTMTGAQRKEVSVRMKRYWAEWRKQKGKEK